MAQNSKQVALAELATELKSRCQNDASGKVYVTTSTNSFAQIGLKEGEIIAITYGNKKGIAALDALSDSQWVIPVFMPSTTYTEEVMVLPSNEEIFTRLSTASSSPVVPSIASPPLPVATGEPHLDDRLSQEVKERLRQTLANYIGPMAGPVCSKILPTVDNIEAAIAALAAKIPELERAGAFRAEARKNV